MTAYLKVRSWHLVTDSTDGYRTRCGLHLYVSPPISDRLPLDERSCESCLRLDRHDAETVPADDTVPG